MPNVVKEDGAFGKWLYLEGRDLINGISILIKETLQSSLAPSAKWRNSEVSWLQPWRQLIAQSNQVGTLTLDFQPP